MAKNTTQHEEALFPPWCYTGLLHNDLCLLYFINLHPLTHPLAKKEAEALEKVTYYFEREAVDMDIIVHQGDIVCVWYIK